VLDTDDPAAIPTTMKALMTGTVGAEGFTWNANAGTVAELPVEQLVLTGAAAVGPLVDYATISVVTLDKQVIVTAGPDRGLLEATIKAVKAGDRGLEANARVTAARAHLEPGAQVVLLAAAQRLKTIGEPGEVKTLSAAALTAKRDRLVVDIWVPSSEVAAAL